MASQKRSNNKHLCGRRAHVENIMVKASGVRVRRGSGKRRVRKNGKTMNQSVQVTLLKVTY